MPLQEADAQREEIAWHEGDSYTGEKSSNDFDRNTVVIPEILRLAGQVSTCFRIGSRQPARKEVTSIILHNFLNLSLIRLGQAAQQRHTDTCSEILRTK